jgi:hypothetical protein
MGFVALLVAISAIKPSPDLIDDLIGAEVACAQLDMLAKSKAKTTQHFFERRLDNKLPPKYQQPIQPPQSSKQDYLNEGVLQ